MLLEMKVPSPGESISEVEIAQWLVEDGDYVKKDQEIVVIESVKAASDILAPLDGIITEINDKIVDDPSIVNSDPLGEGWFFKMKLNNPSELDKLLDKEEYDKLTS